MTNLKFTRKTAGHYTAIVPSGTIEIKKGIGIDSDKWYVYFPCGKTSYRRSYDAAKTWANNYLDKQPKQLTVTTAPKKAESKSNPTTPTQTLRTKLSQANAYVIGADYLGCINTGRSACIIHIVVDNKDYYLVGLDGAVLDTYFQRTVSNIRKQLMEDRTVKSYHHQTFGEVKIYTTFSQAEKEYNRINEAVKSANLDEKKIINEAKTKIKNGEATMTEYFALSDRGVI
jgi:hypothetical protein